MALWRSGLLGLAAGCALALLTGADSKEKFVPVQLPAENTSRAPDGPMLDSAMHRIAPGDYLLINFFDGKIAEEYKVQVDSAGEITLPLINATLLGGLVPRDAAELLMQSFSVYYRNPQVSVQVLDYGQIEVFVFGPDFPGAVLKLDNGSRLSDLLKTLRAEQEFVEYGKYRRLHLVRGGFDFSAITAPQPLTTTASAAPNTLATPSPNAISHSKGSLAGFQNYRPWLEQRMHDPDSQVWVLDPLQITVEGELSRFNITLADKDALFIPTAERFVELVGTAAPGRYELLDNESLGDLLRLAGSLNYRNDLANALIERRDDCGKLQRLIFNMFSALDDLSCIEDFPLQNRDRISFVSPEQRIFVMGEVKLAGAYGFAEDSTVLDYIAIAGGETPDANLGWIALIRQGRDRLNPLDAAEVIQVNFKDIAKGKPFAANLFPIPGDVIWVPPKGGTFDTSQLLQAASTFVTGFAVVDSLQSNSSSSSN